MSERNYPVVEQKQLKKVLVKTDDVDVTVIKDKSFSFSLNHSCMMKGSMDENRIVFEIESNEQRHAEFELCVPDDFEEIRVETESGDIEVVKVKADVLKLYSKRGDVKIEEAQAVLLVKTQSGDIDADSCEAEQVVLNSTSGDIDVEMNEAREVNIKSTSGEIELELNHAQICVLESVSGDIEFEGSADHLKITSKSGDVEAGCFNPNEIQIETASGDTEVSLKGCSGLEGIVETVSGKAELNLEDVLVSENALYWKDGSAKIIIKTVSGDISLEEE